MRAVLTLCFLLLAPAPARAAPAETEPLRLPQVEVREQGTKNGKSFVVLAFKPLPRGAALEQLTVEEARAFAQALEEAFGAKGERLGRSPSQVLAAGLFSGHASPPPTGSTAEEQRIRDEYERIYGPPQLPLPESLQNSKFVTALKLSPKYMPEGVRAGAQELLSSRTAAIAIAVSGMAYLALWLAPAPALSKAIASGLAITLMVVYGVSEIINVAKAFVQLYRDVRDATSLEQLESAARRFGDTTSLPIRTTFATKMEDLGSHASEISSPRQEWNWVTRPISSSLLTTRGPIRKSITRMSSSGFSPPWERVMPSLIAGAVL